MNVNDESKVGINLNITNKMILTADMPGPVNQPKTEDTRLSKKTIQKFQSLNLMLFHDDFSNPWIY